MLRTGDKGFSHIDERFVVVNNDMRILNEEFPSGDLTIMKPAGLAPHRVDGTTIVLLQKGAAVGTLVFWIDMIAVYIVFDTRNFSVADAEHRELAAATAYFASGVIIGEIGLGVCLRHTHHSKPW